MNQWINESVIQWIRQRINERMNVNEPTSSTAQGGGGSSKIGNL